MYRCPPASASRWASDATRMRALRSACAGQDRKDQAVGGSAKLVLGRLARHFRSWLGKRKRPGSSPEDAWQTSRPAQWSLESRQRRSDLFGSVLFFDPPWDALLVLLSHEPHRFSWTAEELSLALDVPVDPLLGWLKALESDSLIWRRESFLEEHFVEVGLTSEARHLLDVYFSGQEVPGSHSD